jgi:Sulfur transfer protein involved in thiamine biosynthesis
MAAREGKRGKVLRVRLEPQGRELLQPAPCKVSSLLKRLGLNAEAVLVIRGDELVVEDELLRAGDEIEIRSVISGGLAS